MILILVSTMTTMTKVAPAAPVAPWMGGKKTLHKKIIAKIERMPHDTYVEPFVGMGGVFLRRTWRPNCEVMNDLNGEIFNLFRILQRHFPQFMEVMRFQITSRQEFERLRACAPEALTDLERAARFLYLQRLAFGGRLGGVFAVEPGHRSRFSIGRLEPILDAAHARLDGVVFENLPWQSVLERWDSPKSLFYLDPPYWGGENDYGKLMFSRDDFAKMAQTLRDIKGQFILSINDVPEIREIFSGFHFEEAALKYSVSRGAATDAKELIITRQEVAAGLL